MKQSAVLTRNNMDGVSTTRTHLVYCYRPVSTEIQTQLGSGVEGTRRQQSDYSAGTLSPVLENRSPRPSPQDATGKPKHVAATSVREYRRTYTSAEEPHTGGRSGFTCCVSKHVSHQVDVLRRKVS